MTKFSDYGFDYTRYLNTKLEKFNSSKQYRFDATNPILNISTSCSVGILPSSTSSEVVVEIDADAKEIDNFRVWQNRNIITVEQTGMNNSGSGISINGVTMSGGNASININGQNIRVVNGRTYVNGVEINGAEQSKSYREPKIRILAPTGSNLDANITGKGILVSKVPLQSAEIELCSSAEVGLAAYNLYCDIQGQGSGYFIAGGGEVNINLSGQGTIKVQGKWSAAKVSLSGMGSIMTEGTCMGDYRANVSGMGTVTHYGRVMGRIKRSLSGMGSINIQQ